MTNLVREPLYGWSVSAFVNYKEYLDWCEKMGTVPEKTYPAGMAEIESRQLLRDTLNITITLHGPPAVTNAIQTCLDIRSLREYLERQIKEEVGNIAKVGTVALMCKVQIKEAE